MELIRVMPAERGNDIPAQHTDIAVVGGGVVGLSVAWRAALRGLSVALYDRGELGCGTSRAAAGMLAPGAEADPGERELLELGVRSAALWPAFAAELGVPLRDRGTLMLARDRDEAEALERERVTLEGLEVHAEKLLPSAARRLEPALAPALRLALRLSGDRAVDPRLLLAALIEACRAAGVQLRPHTPVDDPAALDADRVVVATGAWAGPPVRPVKGQALLLRDPAGPGLCEHVLRWSGGYLVPRGDGRYYLGATVEESGFDLAPTALAAYELLRDAAELIPGALELEIEEHVVGLRPATPDNTPLIGPDPADERIVRALGHYRNGILLAPVTAELVLDVAGAVPA